MSVDAYQSPEADLSNSSNDVRVLSPKQILFTMEGRIGRKTYWLYYLGTVFSLLILFGILMAVLPSAGGESVIGGVIMMGAMLVFYVLMIWVSICISGKRWHDRNKSAWWILISFVPIIGGFWLLIENGFLKGDDGENRFGPPPF
ncbi:DUF805 domain-containing protein [Agaribacter marinus]|uniref:DUF805 domain-containing protein n=1 Tax=Agaribacter marinus TaxID=1431249 RepID=A0AA37WJE5_9ALTE|nr:DUF805 domain-containing protein [Agaribacter marinus]GLR72092.1 DUF805 domain-containing protein [Agaribacter marinus]